MSSKDDVKKYPCYKLAHGRLIRIEPPTSWNIWEIQCHHYIEQQWIKRNPEKFKEIENLQKLIFLTPECHADVTNRHSRFKEKYGIDLSELVYNERNN